MSKTREDKSEYNQGEPQEIQDNQNPHKYFAMIPNMVDDSDLDPYERTLYSHYVRVGTCIESTATTAKKTNMSTGKVSEARTALAEKGWIFIAWSRYGTCEITILDRWSENMEKYSPREQRSPGEDSVHLVNRPFTTRTRRSPGETKKNHNIKPVQEPVSKTQEPEIDYYRSLTPEEESIFQALFADIETEMPQMRPRDCERIKELFLELPQLDPHLYALKQTKQHAAGFNLSYYEQCLRSYNGNPKQIAVLANGN